MLAAAIIFLVLSAMCFATAVHGYAKIEAAKEKERRKLRQTTAYRRKHPLVFISYRRPDLELAAACAERLKAEGYEVVKYDPDSLWDNPFQEIIDGIEAANAIVYVSGSSSTWIKGELELTERLGLPLFTVRSVDDLDIQLPVIRQASDKLDLVARLGCMHPHDREFLATKLLAGHVDNLNADTPRGRDLRLWMQYGDIAKDPGYFVDRLKYVGGAVGFYASGAIAALLFIIYFVID